MADFDRVITINNKYKYAYAYRGYTYHLIGEYEKAIADYNYAISIDGKFVWAITNRGETYLSMENYEKALENFDLSIVLDENNTWGFLHRADLYAQTNQYELAISDLDRAIAIDSEFIPAIINRGEIYQEAGKYKQALKDYSRVIDLEETPYHLTTRGDLYWEIGEINLALEDFSRAVELNNKYHRAREGRGVVLRSLNRLPEAIEMFSHPEEGILTCASCLGHRGEIYRRMGNMEQALTDINRAIELETGDHSYEHSRRSAIYNRLGNKVNRDNDISQVTRLTSEEAHILYNKAVVLTLIDNYQEALQYLKGAIGKDSSARTYARYDDLLQPLTSFSEFHEIIKPPII